MAMAEENTRQDTGCNREDGILETTSEIEVADASIPLFNYVIYVVMTLTCLYYLFTHFSAPR